MTNPKYPNIEVQLTGRDGNIFGIIGRTEDAMKRDGVDPKERNKFVNEMMSCGSYDDALRCVQRWVRGR